MAGALRHEHPRLFAVRAHRVGREPRARLRLPRTRTAGNGIDDDRDHDGALAALISTYFNGRRCVAPSVTSVISTTSAEIFVTLKRAVIESPSFATKN